MRSDWPKSVMLTTGCAVAGLGTAVLVAWHVHFIPLIQALPGHTPMHRMTALGFLLSGVALVFTAAGRKRAAAALALAPLIIAVLVWFEYALGADFAIDQILGRDYVRVHTSHPGRMAPVTALCFVVSSVALLVTASRRLEKFASAIVGILASILLAVGTVSVLVYLLGGEEVYGWSQFTRIALHTAAGLAVLGAGLMTWACREDKERKATPRWLPLGLGLGLAVGALGVWQALVAHQQSELMLISHTVLAGGLVGAVLVAMAVAQAQKARKRSRELQASGMMLHQLFETAPDGLIMINRQGIVLRVNQRAENMFGYAHDEIPGALIENLIPGKLRYLHPIHREGFYAAPSTRLMGQGVELAARRNDGSEFPVEISLTPLQSPENELVVVAVVRDITERKRAQEALRHSEERFRKVFEEGPMGLALIGTNYRVVKINRALSRMTGYTEAELMSKSFQELTHPDDPYFDTSRGEPLFGGKVPLVKMEKRYVKKDGEIMWANVTVAAIHGADQPLYGLVMIEDTTERRRAEAAVRLGNEIFANMEEAVCLIRVEEGIIVHANLKFEKMFGYGPDELTGKRVLEINADTDRPAREVAEEIRAEIRRSGVWRGEILHRRKDGTLFWCAVTGSIFHHPEFGEVGVSIHQDITELKKAQEALLESEERFRGIFEQGPIGVVLVDLDYRMTKTNPAFCRMLGYSETELAQKTPLDITHPDDHDSCADLLERLYRDDVPVCKTEKRYVKKNGEVMWINLTASMIRDREGRALYGLGMVEDITERKKAEKKVAEQAALLNLAQDSIAVRDMEGRIIFWNRGGTETYGWSAEEALGRRPQELLHSRYPIPLKEIEAMVFTRGAWEGELEQITRDGKHIVVASRWSLWRDERGAPRAILVINRDITHRKRTEEQLHSLTERLSLATSTASIGVWDWDLRTNQSVWDDIVFENFGIPKASSVPYEEFARRVHPDDLPGVEASLQRVIARKTQEFVEFRIIRPDGSVRHISAAQGVVLDERGKVVRIVGTSVDITERKRMEAQIEANKEQLVTSARLSALGMMAGNIAHEINNPVGIIHALASNLIDMVEQEEAAPPEMVTQSARRIRQTAERISGIVKSLLQISREGSSDRLRATPIGKILDETLEICRARFRSNGVQLILPANAPDLTVFCREAQIAQVLLNLLQNAFDAVVDHAGERWVRADVTPHEDSVVISVTDSGPGIPPELRSRIMEPFFTTKPVGKGTGLGLSLSKTIAEEHGGKLEYAEDHGKTCFTLRLPIVREAEAVWS